MLQLFLAHIGGVADDDVEDTVVSGTQESEHPGGVEERGGPLRLVRVPFDDPLGVVRGEGASRFESLGQFVAELLVTDAQGFLLPVATGSEVVVAHCHQGCFEAAHPFVSEAKLSALEPQEGVGRDELRFEVWQGEDATIRCIGVDGLVHDEGDEAAQPGDLYGDGLDIDAVEAVLDEVELSAVVVVVAGEGTFDRAPGRLTRGRTLDAIEGRFLPAAPSGVVRIELSQEGDELLKHPDREGAGAAGWVEDLEVIDRIDEGFGLGGGKARDLLLPGEEPAESAIGRLQRIDPPKTSKNPVEVAQEDLIDHPVHDDPRRVEGTGRLSRHATGLRIEGCQKVLEDMAEEFGIEGDLLGKGRVLHEREVVAPQDLQEGTDTLTPPLLVPIGAGEIDDPLRPEEEIVGELGLLSRILGEAIDAHLLGEGGVSPRPPVVQALEEAAVEERNGPQQAGEGFRVAQETGIAPEGMDHVILTAPPCPRVEETTPGRLPRPVWLRVQRRKEEVLKDRGIVGASVR